MGKIKDAPGNVTLYTFPYAFEVLGLEDRLVQFASKLIGAVPGRRLRYGGPPNPRLRGDDPDPAGAGLEDVVAESPAVLHYPLPVRLPGTSLRMILLSIAPLTRFQASRRDRSSTEAWAGAPYVTAE